MQKYEQNLTANSSGALRPLAGASVTVTDNANGLPAALYSDNGVTPLPQPLTTDGTGYFGFYAADGRYTLTFSGPRFATFTREILLEDPADNPAVTVQELGLPSAADKIGYGGRKVSDKLGEVASVKDFGAKGDGVSDDTAAIQAALTACAGKRLRVPAGTYNITAPTGGDGTQIVEYDQGVTIIGGGGIYNAARIDFKSGVVHHSRTGTPSEYETVGALFRSTNSGTAGGYGMRVNYVQDGISTSGFSIGHGVVCNLKGISGSQGLASWLVAASPTDPTRNFGVFGQEVNVINRAGDSGYSKRRGALTRWTGGIQAIPEGTDLTGEAGNACYNVLFGFAVAPSGHNKADGKPAKTYNAFLCEQDGVAPNGRAFLAAGDSTGVAEDLPQAAFDVDQRFRFGLRLRDGIYDQGRAILVGNNQWVAIENAAGTVGFKVLGVNTADNVVIGAVKAGGDILISGNSGSGPSPSGEPSFVVRTSVNPTVHLRAEASEGTTGTGTLTCGGTLANASVQIKPKGTGVTMLTGVREYADDAAAAAGGVPVTGIYRTGSVLKIRVA